MINPAKVQALLQQLPDNQLMEMLKRPDKIPSMFVQQELKRRQQMRMAGKAQQSQQAMPKPQPQQQPQQPIGMDEGGSPGLMEIIKNILGQGQMPYSQKTNMNPAYVPLPGEENFGKSDTNQVLENELINFRKKGQFGGQGFPANMSTALEEKKKQEIDKKINKDEKKNNNKSPQSMINDLKLYQETPYKYEYSYSPEGVLNTGKMSQDNDSSSFMQKLFPALKGKSAVTGAVPGSMVDRQIQQSIRKKQADKFSTLGKKQAGIQSLQTTPNSSNTSSTQINVPEFGPPSARGSKAKGNAGGNVVTQNNDQSLDSPSTKANKFQSIYNNLKADYEKDTPASAFGQQLNEMISATNALTKSASEETRKGISSINKNTNNAIKAINDNTANLVFTNDDIKRLRNERDDHAEEAYKFMMNDSSIVDAQKKLIESMKPQASASNKFFMYLAQVGARIAGSDKTNFLAAAGEALDKTLSEVKIDNESERNMFVERAKMGIEFEEARRQNKLAAMNFKSQVFGQQLQDQETDLANKNAITKSKIEATFKTTQLNTNAMNALSNMHSTVANLNNDQLRTVGNLIQTEMSRKDTKANNLANLQLEIAKLSEGPADVETFKYYMSLPEDQQADFVKIMGGSSNTGNLKDLAKVAADNAKAQIDAIKAQYINDPDGLLAMSNQIIAQEFARLNIPTQDVGGAVNSTDPLGLATSN